MRPAAIAAVSKTVEAAWTQRSERFGASSIDVSDDAVRASVDCVGFGAALFVCVLGFCGLVPSRPPVFDAVVDLVAAGAEVVLVAGFAAARFVAVAPLSVRFGEVAACVFFADVAVWVAAGRFRAAAFLGAAGFGDVDAPAFGRSVPLDAAAGFSAVFAFCAVFPRARGGAAAFVRCGFASLDFGVESSVAITSSQGRQTLQQTASQANTEMMIKRLIVLAVLVPPLLGCGRLAHLAPAGFGGGKPPPSDPEVARRIDEERERAARRYAPLSDVPGPPADLPTDAWADSVRRELLEKAAPPMSGDDETR